MYSVKQHRLHPLGVIIGRRHAHSAPPYVDMHRVPLHTYPVPLQKKVSSGYINTYIYKLQAYIMCITHIAPSYVPCSSTTKPRVDMSQLLLLGKVEYGGGPIFKVVLEC